MSVFSITPTSIIYNQNASFIGGLQAANISSPGNVSFRNLSVNTIDSITATTLSIGTSNATAINIGRGAVTTTINGPLTATGLITATGGLTMGNNITLSASPPQILPNQIGSATGITYSGAPIRSGGAQTNIGSTEALPNNTVWFLQGCIGIPNLTGNWFVNINIGLSLAAQNMSCSITALYFAYSGINYLSCSTIVIGGNTACYLNCSSTNVFTPNSVRFSAFRIA